MDEEDRREEEEEDVYPMDGADLGACWCHDSAVCPDYLLDLIEWNQDWQEDWHRG